MRHRNADTKARLVNPLTRNTLALILAGGSGTRLYELTEWRAKPALHFGGKMRIVDFPLSNCINSGIRRIGVLTQYKAHSLIRHLVRGWTRFQAANHEFIDVLPASQQVENRWYRGTADAVYQNLDLVRIHDPELVLILASDHVYKMDYGDLLAWHSGKQADMTVVCLEVPIEDAAGQFGVITVNEDGRVIAFDEKPDRPTPIPGRDDTCLASMGNYVFRSDFLIEQMIADAGNPESDHDFGHNVIPSLIEEHRVYAYPFRNEGDTGPSGKAYWRDVGTLDTYWKANLELTQPEPPLDLHDEVWPIFTAPSELPPPKFLFDRVRSEVNQSMVSEGCLIAGARVEDSVVFSNCTVCAESRIEESLILPDCEIGENCDIRRAIVGRSVRLPDGTQIGVDAAADRARGFRVTDSGVTLVTPGMVGQETHNIE